MKDVIAVSGINIFEGGALKVYHQFCDEIISAELDRKYQFILFVHKKQLFEQYEEHFTIIELPDSRESWLKRLYYEYIYFMKFSKQHDILLWISLHDMTPRVRAKHQLTYFHNPTFAHKASYEDFKYSKKVFLFSLFYKYLYKLNVNANDYVIVQQDWISKEINRIIPSIHGKIIVMPLERNIPQENNHDVLKLQPYMFFFPSVSRHFKNFEIICEAAKRLNNRNEKNKFQVYLTIDGSEDKYSREIFENYGNEDNIHFIGYQNRNEMAELYKKASCLIFPSKMETWGLPITEAKEAGLPVIAADLPYAHETVGTYDKACFFNESDAEELADCMKKAYSGEAVFQKAEYNPSSKLILRKWAEVIEKTIEGDI